MQAANMETETQQRLKREYLEHRIRAAHPIELVTMLYQIAIENLNAAMGHLKTGDRLARSRAVTRSEQAVHELLIALDHSVNVEFTYTLAKLYRYCLDRMVAGHATQTEEPFREALSVLETLAVAWREIKERTVGEAAKSAGGTDVEAPAEEPTHQVVKDRYSKYQQDPEKVGERDWSC